MKQIDIKKRNWYLTNSFFDVYIIYRELVGYQASFFQHG